MSLFISSRKKGWGIDVADYAVVIVLNFTILSVCVHMYICGHACL